MPKATSFITLHLQDGESKMDKVVLWLNMTSVKINQWPGVERHTFSKVNAGTVMGVIVYESMESLEANTPAFATVFEEAKEMYFVGMDISNGEALVERGPALGPLAAWLGAL
jgi:hypothetical protein